MPVVMELKDGLLRMNLIGEYEPPEIAAAFKAAIADPKTPERVAFLVDVTRSESLKKRSPDEIRDTGEALGPYADRIGGRVAVIATEGLLFGLSRMGSVYTSGVGVDAQIFKDEASALEWLGVVTPGRPSP